MQCSIEHWDAVEAKIHDKYAGEPVPSELTRTLLSLCPDPDAVCGRWVEVSGFRIGRWEAFAIQGATLSHVVCEPAQNEHHLMREHHMITEAELWPLAHIRGMKLVGSKMMGSDNKTVHWAGSWKLILKDSEISLPEPYETGDQREVFAAAVRDRLAAV